MISGKDIEIVRSIHRAGHDYDTIKRLLGETQWKIEEDETDLGFLRIGIPAERDSGYYTLINCYRDPDRPPFSLLTFACFGETEEQIAAFNACFLSAAGAIAQHLGPPAVRGNRQLPSCNWSYAYQRWSLPEGEFTLVQDEFDIQSGLDVTLWIQPVGTPLEETLHLTTAVAETPKDGAPTGVNKISEILKIVAFSVVGLIVAEAILLLVAVVKFGFHDGESFRKFMTLVNPVTAVAGGLFGFFFAKEIAGRLKNRHQI